MDDGFKYAPEMPYANNPYTQSKTTTLLKQLTEHLKSIKKDNSLFFTKDEVVYIPDIHGDFIHLISTLHRHDLVDKDLNLRKCFQFVFLGDFYDRAPDADVIDSWLNKQIKNQVSIYRLLGNHEIAFFERDKKGHPTIFPSHDSIKDITNNFQITENLLKNIASGNILAAYVEANSSIIYVHSYITNNDFAELDLESNTNILVFAQTLNKRLQEHGQKAYEIFLDCKEKNQFNWGLIIKPFSGDPLFNIYSTKNDIHTSFLWRRTGSPTLRVFPCELEVDIPNNVYQIVGHTPVFSFNRIKEQPTNKPFIISTNTGTGKIQFSDVGIGYYYNNNTLERPEVIIGKIK